MIDTGRLRLIAVPRRVRVWFHTHVQAETRSRYYIPVWMIQDVLGVRFASNVDHLKVAVSIDVKRKLLVIEPALIPSKIRLYDSEYRVHRGRFDSFVYFSLPHITEIFQVEPPARYRATVNRKQGAIIVHMGKALDPSPCVH